MAGKSSAGDGAVDARRGGAAAEADEGRRPLCSIPAEECMSSDSASMASQPANSHQHANSSMDGREKGQDEAADGLKVPRVLHQSQKQQDHSAAASLMYASHEHCNLKSMLPTPDTAACETAPSAADHPHTPTEKTANGYCVDSSSTSTSTSSEDLFDMLRASLSSSPRSSTWPSPASTRRGSQSTRGGAALYSSSSTSSGPPSPQNTAATSSPPSRRKSTSEIVAAPFTASTHTLTSVITKTSQVATSLVTVHQAISLSLYILVTLIASFTLITILVAGYGLTLADDLKYKIAVLGKKADQQRRKLLFDLEEWLRITNENLKQRQAALDQAYPPRRQRKRFSFPSASETRKSDLRESQHGRQKATLENLRVYATIAFSRLPFSIPFSEASSTSKSRQKLRSQPSSRPRSRFSSPPCGSSSPSSASTSSSSSSSSWSKIPPRPPLSVLVPSMILALVLALVALFKNRRKDTAKNRSSTSSYR